MGAERQTRRPRIGLNAHLLSLSQSYRSAGVSRYIASLLAHLPQVDPSADYVALLGDGRVSAPGWRRQVSPWPTARPAARILWEQLGQPWATWRERLDLLHLPVYVAPLIAPCPTVVTVHDLTFYLYPHLFRRSRRAYLQRLTWLSAQRALAVIADSASTRQDVVRLLDVSEDRVHVIPIGVDESLRPLPRDEVEDWRRRRGLPERMLLYLGTLEPRKNLVTLLEAYAYLRSRGDLAHRLVLAGGKGWFYDDIYAAAERLGVQHEVLFPGFVPQEELAFWYNAADLFVYPSLYEGFGLPPLEAMACGTPVVTSNVSAMPEVVSDAGLLVDPGDPQALAAAVENALQDEPLRARLRVAGLARAREYTWARTATETARLYHRLLQE